MWRFNAVNYCRPSATCERNIYNEPCHPLPPRKTQQHLPWATTYKYPRSAPQAEMLGIQNDVLVHVNYLYGHVCIASSRPEETKRANSLLAMKKQAKKGTGRREKNRLCDIGSELRLMRGAILNRTYGTHKNLHVSLFLQTAFGPVYYGPP